MEKRMKKNSLLRTEQQHPITRLVLYMTTFLLLAVCFLPFVSGTTPTPTINLPGGTVTMIATDGDVSYFDIHLSEVPSGYDVTNGDYEGWCADRAVTMPRGEPLTIQLQDSYDPNLPWSLKDKDWAKANDILNHHDSIPMKDVQDALWYLLCETNYSTLSDAAKTLVDSADPAFIPAADEWVAIIAEPIQNDSHSWPFQIAFLQVKLLPQEPSDPENPEEPEESIQTTTVTSHGFRYNDIAPTADNNGPYTGFAKETIEFSGITSSDPDGIIISYHWSFGDGTTAEGVSATHTYSHAGLYYVSLTVMDNFGLTGTNLTTATITIRNSPPTTPSIMGPANGTTNTNYSYTFRSTDNDHGQITYRIDWGDGTAIQTATLPSGQYFALLHHWNAPGTYTISASASDSSQIATAGKDVRINELPIAENIWILALAFLAIIASFAILLFSKRTKNQQ